MSRWVMLGAGTVAAVLAALGVAVLVGGALWRRATDDALERLAAAGDAEGGSRPAAAHRDAEALPPAAAHRDAEALPPPVARWFERALPEGRPTIRSATVRWEGAMRLRPDADWVPFTADQDFNGRPPGFVWDAAVDMLPLVPVRVRDTYLRGEASMLGRVGGVVSVVDEGGTPEIAQSALVRWIGEAVWLPTALLPTAPPPTAPPPGEGGGTRVRWTAVDDSTARVTVVDGAVRATAEFRFGSDGTVTGMTATRYRDVDGVPVPTPFEGVYGDWARRDGFLVPLSAEVAWLLPEGRYAYWRGGPTGIRYRLTPRAP